MFTEHQFNDEHKETNIIDVTNIILTLANNNDKNIPYSEYSKIQLRLFDSPGKEVADNLNIKLISDMKALFFLFDITNENTYNDINKKISNTKNIFEKSIKNEKNNENIIKQPKSFEEIPIIIIGNKNDMETNRKVKKTQIEELIQNLKEKNKFSFINYHEISVKYNKGIKNIFEDIIHYYFKRKIDNSNKKIKSMNNNNIIINEEKEIKKPSLDKKMFIYHQMLAKYKKKIILEIENTKNEFEKELKNKNEEIEKMKQELFFAKNGITLKFKIPDKEVKDEISINAKGETKVFDVINMLYELCPSINNLNIKGFRVEGKENEIIDEMKTVKENKLVNGSMIVLIL